MERRAAAIVPPGESGRTSGLPSILMNAGFPALRVIPESAQRLSGTHKRKL
jgi:hypothetical protein